MYLNNFVWLLLKLFVVANRPTIIFYIDLVIFYIVIMIIPILDHTFVVPLHCTTQLCTLLYKVDVIVNFSLP